MKHLVFSLHKNAVIYPVYIFCGNKFVHAITDDSVIGYMYMFPKWWLFYKMIKSLDRDSVSNI